MAKEEKILRVNVPFRVLPETIEQLREVAKADDNRTPANMLEKLVKEAHGKLKKKDKA